MFEATLVKGVLFKKIVEAIKDLVSDGIFEVNEAGIHLQAMDSSHVALVSLSLPSDMFAHFRCDRTVRRGAEGGRRGPRRRPLQRPLGINLPAALQT